MKEQDRFRVLVRLFDEFLQSGERDFARWADLHQSDTPPDVLDEVQAMLAADARFSHLTNDLLHATQRSLIGHLSPERFRDFEIDQHLGTGGMGMVFSAMQRDIGRRVALKVMRPELLHVEEAKQRFRREASAIARLQHPNIGALHTFGESDGIPYLAMELIPGRTMADVIQSLPGDAACALTGEDLYLAAGGDPNSDSRPDLFRGAFADAAVRIIAEVAEALDHAHGRGVLHRDVKPSNIMITAEGRVFVVDFGLAHASGADRLTRVGSDAGTVAYMAPEVVRDGMTSYTARSDLYSLAVTSFELLTRSLPFEGATSHETRRLILAANPVSAARRDPSISWELSVVCQKAMDADPDARYESVAAFRVDLANVLSRRPIHARPASMVRRARRLVQRRPALAAAVVLGVLAIVVMPGILLVRERLAGLELQARESEARAAKDQAEASLELAMGAITTMIQEIEDRNLDPIPGITAIRERMTLKAGEKYESIRRLGHRSLELDVQTAIGRARQQVLASERDVPGAHDAAEQAISKLRTLLRESPLDPKRRADADYQLFRILDRRTMVLLSSGDAKAALMDQDRLFGERLAPRLTGIEKSDAAVMLALAHHRLGDSKRALELSRGAVQHLREIAAKEPSPRASAALAWALVVEAGAYKVSGDIPRCRALLAEVEQLAAPLFQDATLRVEATLFHCHVLQLQTFPSAGTPEQKRDPQRLSLRARHGRAAIRAGEAWLRATVRPTQLDVVLFLRTLLRHARTLRDMGQVEDSLAMCRRARDLLPLVPSPNVRARQLASIQVWIASTELGRGQRKAAGSAVRAGIAALQGSAARGPEVDRVRFELHLLSTQIHRQEGDHGAACESFRDGILASDAWLRAAPAEQPLAKRMRRGLMGEFDQLLTRLGKEDVDVLDKGARISLDLWSSHKEESGLAMLAYLWAGKFAAYAVNDPKRRIDAASALQSACGAFDALRSDAPSEAIVENLWRNCCAVLVLDKLQRQGSPPGRAAAAAWSGLLRTTRDQLAHERRLSEAMRAAVGRRITDLLTWLE